MVKTMSLLQRLLKSKMKSIFLFFCASACATMIFYFALRDPASLPKRPPKRKQSMENINALMDITQNPNNVKKQKQYEFQMLQNLTKKSNEPQKNRLRGPVHSKVFEANRRGDYSKMHKLVHLDLKGAPPKIEYLKTLIPFIKQLGATGILIEYEDMFPYSGALHELAARNSYTVKDINTIVSLSKDLDLEVIPLVQTFGHMEFILKLKSFQHLREVPEYPQVICPSQNATMKVIKMMIDQIIDLHPNLNWLHIGCDEVYNLGVCSSCKKMLKQQAWSRSNLFLHHVKTIASYVKTSYDVQPIIWDDEFRAFSKSDLSSSGIGEVAELMVWKYTKDVPNSLPSDIWEKYSTMFHTLWIATAFKGATGPDQLITDPSYHMDNHRSWLTVLEDNKDNILFRGAAITGWQRYDHFAVLCELLPAAMPSLAACLHLLNNHVGNTRSDITPYVRTTLKCDGTFNLQIEGLYYATECRFPGSEVYKGIQLLFLWKKKFDALMQNPNILGWMNAFNIRKKFSSPARIEDGTKNLLDLERELENIRHSLKTQLSKLFDIYTVEEWLETFIEPWEKKVANLKEDSVSLKHLRDWPRRPVYNQNRGEDL